MVRDNDIGFMYDELDYNYHNNNKNTPHQYCYQHKLSLLINPSTNWNQSNNYVHQQNDH